MPNIKSAKKRVLVNKTKAARNKALKSNLKTVVKSANAAIDTNAEKMCIRDRNIPYNISIPGFIPDAGKSFLVQPVDRQFYRIRSQVNQCLIHHDIPCFPVELQLLSPLRIFRFLILAVISFRSLPFFFRLMLIYPYKGTVLRINVVKLLIGFCLFWKVLLIQPFFHHAADKGIDDRKMCIRDRVHTVAIFSIILKQGVCPSRTKTRLVYSIRSRRCLLYTSRCV